MKSKIDIQELYCGVQGSGKTWAMRADVKGYIEPKTKRRNSWELIGGTLRDGVENTGPDLLVFDPFGEWRDPDAFDIKGAPVLDLSETRFSGSTSQRWPYLATSDKDLFLDYAERSHGSVIVTEELLHFDRSDFVRFRRLSSSRRHKGNALFASTQRPSHLPVIMVSSCTQIHVLRLISKDDSKRLIGFANHTLKSEDFSCFTPGQRVKLLT